MASILKSRNNEEDEHLIAEATQRIKNRKLMESENDLITIVHKLEKDRDNQELKTLVAHTAMRFVGHTLPRGRKAKAIPEV